jgi:hypothetical protein
MHQDDMWIAHPQTDWTETCDQCHGKVGIYPSGQNYIKRYRRANIDIKCNRCQLPGQSAVLAPGVYQEVHESVLIMRPPNK